MRTSSGKWGDDVSDGSEIPELLNAVRLITDGVVRLIAAMVASSGDMLELPETEGAEETDEVERQIITLLVVSLTWRALTSLVRHGQSSVDVEEQDLQRMQRGERQWSREGLVSALLEDAESALALGSLRGVDRLEQEFQERIGTVSRKAAE